MNATWPKLPVLGVIPAVASHLDFLPEVAGMAVKGRYLLRLFRLGVAGCVFRWTSWSRWMLAWVTSTTFPKGFVRARNYGHASTSQRQPYLSRCRKLLGIDEPEEGNSPAGNEPELGPLQDENGFEIEIDGGVSLRCPQCGQLMTCVSFTHRPSWREVMAGPDRPDWHES